VVITPVQGLGQIEDAVAQSIGRATAEHLAFTDDAASLN
jgi:CO/xanthine dehydrogenase Mo-binding subunit